MQKQRSGTRIRGSLRHLRDIYTATVLPEAQYLPVAPFRERFRSDIPVRAFTTSPTAMSQKPGPALARDLTFPNSGVSTPRLVYGTAWKKDRTADLVYAALRAGFRGIDTAAQPRHYNERLVGDGIRRAIDDGVVRRQDLFIQTKFTLPGGQDPDNMPYSASSSLEDQVHSSLASSIRNLSVSTGDGPVIDSLVLHSPPSTVTDLIVIWQALESYVPHKVRQLGIANVPASSVLAFIMPSDKGDANGIRVAPSVVQNRFYADTDYDVDLRAYCRARGVLYQSFWTLTANGRTLMPPQGGGRGDGPVRRLAAAASVSPPVALYALVLGLEGTTILDGTTSEAHMREDLEGIQKVGDFAESGDGNDKTVWEECLDEFKGLIGEQDS